MVDQSLRCGNCRGKALEFQRNHGGTIKWVSQGRLAPRHPLVRLDNGDWWHFKKVWFVFPWPFCYLLFVGRYEKLERRI